MPANFVVRSIKPNNGIRQVHLSLDQGQPNEVWLNVTSDVLALIFGDDVREGDVRALQAPLVVRAGSNGVNR
jgi:hypothetical protein